MIIVVPARPHDAMQMAELLEELDRFYGGGTPSEPLEERATKIKAMVFRDQPAAYVLLAKNSGRVIGLAAYSFLWPAVGLSQSLYLKELYVADGARQMGAGRLLMDRLFRIASETGCSRVEWMADRDNPLAVGFYEHMEYPQDSGKILYRLGL